MSMIVMKNKSESKGVSRLHNYLYDSYEENYELLEIYEQIDFEVDDLESKISYNDEYEYLEKEFDSIGKDLDRLVKDFKKMNRAEILEELQRISF